MTFRRLLRAPVLLALPLAFVVGACSEDLETGGACPALCPGQQLDIRDTVLLPAIVFDTTLGDFPFRGEEPWLLLASRPELDVRSIVRFDTLARTFRPTGVDTAEVVTRVDSATFDFRIQRTELPLPETFFIDAYDVSDLTAPDSIPTTLLPHFTAARLLGSVRIDSAGFVDTTLVRIQIDTVKLLATIVDSAKVMRIGLQVRSATPAQVRIFPTTGDASSRGPRLRYRVSADTLIPPALISASSSTPSTPLVISTFYKDYLLIAAAPDIRAAQRFSVGGLPGVRSYLRFELPRWLTDSSAVLRARLELVQDPITGLDDTTDVTIRAQMVLAGHDVTDLSHAVQLLAPINAFVTDSLRLAPGDSGSRFLEINNLVTQWRTVDGTRRVPNALVLRMDNEGSTAAAARFFGVSAAPELQPRLRVSYVPVTSFTFGQP